VVERVNHRAEASPSLTEADYARAERFLPWNAERLIFHVTSKPSWLASENRFWYRVAARNGKQFIIGDAPNQTLRPAFDHARMAESLSNATGTHYEAGALPFDDLHFGDDGSTLEVEFDRTIWRVNTNNYEWTKVEQRNGIESYQLRSPNGRWVASARDANLYVRDTDTGAEVALTSDGVPGYGYATPILSPLLAAGLARPDYVQYPLAQLFPAAIWSPDSRRILTHRIDERSAGRLSVVQSVPLAGTTRPRTITYPYALPGDKDVPTAELFIFDVQSGHCIPLQIPPLNVLYYGSPLRRDRNKLGNPYIWWSSDGQRLYVLRRSRGYETLTLYEVDATDGTSRVLVEESNPTAMDPHVSFAGEPNVRVIDNGSRVIWFSQRDGWGHLYLYDAATGLLDHQITSGEWAVADLLHVDETERWLYFTAVGREPGRDPYYEFFYRISIDTPHSEPQLLTPQDGHHLVSIAPSGQYFVDTWSTLEDAPVTALFRSDGTLLSTLETADLSDLRKTGWHFPERFCAKARDGETDIYGIIIRPSNFDPDRSYPIIDSIYAGPHTNQAPVSFAEIVRTRGSTFWQAQALAELGFVVVMIDGIGMPYRSKAYQDFSYRNLADAGLPDHIAALRQLAQRYPYLDLDRVGVYGHSAGGYSSCQAIFAHPDFYKVAVSSAGNHDHRLDKASWIERYMGLPVAEHYCQQANQSLAHNLRGKLLLIHGEMDENVHPSSTLVVVDALIRANKDFDLLILPNRYHACGDDPYFIRKRWDYFVRHLAGLEPPREYQIAPNPS
jgi:dipeptidyl-peptidase-4